MGIEINGNSGRPPQEAVEASQSQATTGQRAGQSNAGAKNAPTGDQLQLSNQAAQLKALEAEIRSYVGKPIGPIVTARDPVNEPMIHHWCDAIGDRNPAYLDPAAAAATGRDLRSSANESVKSLERALQAQLRRLNSLQLQISA